MARSPNTFVDPAGIRPTYAWAINHLTEEPGGKHRNVRSSAPTALTGLNQLQGDEDPLVLRWKGSILTRAQLVEMWHWFALSRDRTIYLYDFAGDGAEVLFTHFDPQRIALAANHADPVHAPLWKWEYTAEFTVVTFLAGPMFEAGVSP